MPKKLPPVVLTPEQRAELESFASRPTLEQRLAKRAKIVLFFDQGLSTSQVAQRVEFTAATVLKWRARYLENELQGLYDELRSGRPLKHNEAQISALINKTLRDKPPNDSHWSTRSMARASGIPKSSVQRIWKAFCVQPHRQKTFKLSTDPFFVEKVIDIVGLYLNPPQNAVVLCVDEKSQCQALERTQPLLPMGLGYVEGVTHDYLRHGTTTLFAALDVATGTVGHQCKRRHRHTEFLSFLRKVVGEVPGHLDVHVICDNYSPHKHAKVKAWLARNPRVHMHFTPTYSSWLNQVERFFAHITAKAIRRESFQSVNDLEKRIDGFIETYNESATPFKWTATADSIFAKLERLCLGISGAGH